MIGEIIALVVAVSWTATALFAEVATKRIGQLSLNVMRMGVSVLLLMLTLWVATGNPIPLYADGTVWFWLSLSGFVGYVLGDYCLFNSYIVIGSRFGQLFMTLASPFAALAAWILLGETLSWKAMLGMTICVLGIGMSIFGKPNKDEGVKVKLPLRGILLGIGAGAGQGIGLVLSKVGMEHYDKLIPADDSVMQTMVPFASTLMRGITGFFCFALVMTLMGKAGKIATAVRDRKAMMAGFGAILFGPFIGVSLSLMAVHLAPAGIAQTLMSLTPIFILLPAKVIFGNKVTFLEIVGACVAVGGASLFFL